MPGAKTSAATAARRYDFIVPPFLLNWRITPIAKFLSVQRGIIANLVRAFGGAGVFNWNASGAVISIPIVIGIT